MDRWKPATVGWHPIGLANLDILKMDGPTIMDWGGFISVQIEKMGCGCGERSMAGYGVTRQPGRSSGTVPVATGFTCSFEKDRIPSFLIIPPVDIQLITNE